MWCKASEDGEYISREDSGKYAWGQESVSSPTWMNPYLIRVSPIREALKMKQESPPLLNSSFPTEGWMNPTKTSMRLLGDIRIKNLLTLQIGREVNILTLRPFPKEWKKVTYVLTTWRNTTFIKILTVLSSLLKNQLNKKKFINRNSSKPRKTSAATADIMSTICSRQTTLANLPTIPSLNGYMKT